MARVLIELTDNDETGEMDVNYHFDPVPISVEEQDVDMLSVSQDAGIWILEQIMERPLEDQDLFTNIRRSQ